ncbi:hypothetical protein GF357_04770 [Candidatus Dojkabacteria bacterium]|nr:hypothetical protein [Candidatus Dojkabacteria bacterium]
MPQITTWANNLLASESKDQLNAKVLRKGITSAKLKTMIAEYFPHDPKRSYPQEDSPERAACDALIKLLAETIYYEKYHDTDSARRSDILNLDTGLHITPATLKDFIDEDKLENAGNSSEIQRLREIDNYISLSNLLRYYRLAIVLGVTR